MMIIKSKIIGVVASISLFHPITFAADVQVSESDLSRTTITVEDVESGSIQKVDKENNTTLDLDVERDGGDRVVVTKGSLTDDNTGNVIFKTSGKSEVKKTLFGSEYRVSEQNNEYFDSDGKPLGVLQQHSNDKKQLVSNRIYKYDKDGKKSLTNVVEIKDSKLSTYSCDNANATYRNCEKKDVKERELKTMADFDNAIKDMSPKEQKERSPASE